jgi:hypothetical protein
MRFAMQADSPIRGGQDERGRGQSDPGHFGQGASTTRRRAAKREAAMGTIEMIRQEPAAEAAPHPQASLAAFLADRPGDDRVVGLLAYALATEAGAAPTPEAIDRHRQTAVTALSEYAFRYLHNTVEQIRRDAVAEQLGGLRRPPSFARLVLANLLALALGGLAAGWVALHPETLAGLTGLLAG